MKDWLPVPRRAAILKGARRCDREQRSGPALRRGAGACVADATTHVLARGRTARRAGARRAGSAHHVVQRGTRRATLRLVAQARRRAPRGARDPDASELRSDLRACVRARAGGCGPQIRPRTLRRTGLVFGVYAGLVRQAPPRGINAKSTTHRVRRDAVGRLVELAREAAVGAGCGVAGARSRDRRSASSRAPGCDGTRCARLYPRQVHSRRSRWRSPPPRTPARPRSTSSCRSRSTATSVRPSSCGRRSTPTMPTCVHTPHFASRGSIPPAAPSPS